MGPRQLGSWFWICQVGGNPLIIFFTVVLWGLLDIPLPSVLDHGLDIISGMTLPLALLAIGGLFPAKAARLISKSLVTTAVKLAWLSLIIAGILLVPGVHGKELIIGLIFSGISIATVVSITVHQQMSYTVALVLLEGLGC